MAVKFKWRSEEYHKDIVGQLHAGEMVAEYNRLRKIANKRIGNILKSEDFDDLYSMRYYEKAFETAGGQLGFNDLRYKLQEIYKFLSTEETTITAMRKRWKEEIKYLSDNYNIDISFFKKVRPADFYNFMEDMRTLMKDRYYDSGDAISFLSEQDPNLNRSATSLKNEFQKWAREHGARSTGKLEKGKKAPKVDQDKLHNPPKKRKKKV